MPLVYEKIKRSNSSLSRRSKKLLEDSIERVLEVFKEEDSEDDEDDIGSIEADLNDMGERESRVRPKKSTLSGPSKRET